MGPIASRRLEILASNILFFGLTVGLMDTVWATRGTLHKPATLGTLLLGFVMGGYVLAAEGLKQWFCRKFPG